MRKFILTFATMILTLLSLKAQEVFRNDEVTVSVLKEKTWVFETWDKTTMYLLEGNKSALLIDTGTSCEGLADIVRGITKKPYQVVITHAHPDHAGCADQFDEIWLHPADTVLYFRGLDKYKGTVHFMHEGDKFDLGGRELEVFHMPGHTPGSIVLIDRAAGDCYSGDAFGSGEVWLQCIPTSPIRTYLNSCRKMEKIMDEYGPLRIWCGHYPYVKNAFPGPSYIKNMIAVAERLVNNDQKGCIPYHHPTIQMAPSVRRLSVNYHTIVYDSLEVVKECMDEKVSSLMSEMTLDEKIGQLNLPVSGILTGDARSENVAENIRNGHTGGVFGVRGAEQCRKIQEIAVNESRLHIPLIFGFDVIHGYETTFPIPLAQASSWNMELIGNIAHVSAKEASASGIGWVFSPMVDVCHDGRWGRIAEGVGEDPYLGGEIARAMVRGYQGDDMSKTGNVMACVKHYALYGAAEGGRDYNTVDMSRQRIMNEYMLSYKAAAEAGAGSFMASFNEFEGIPATANKYLLTEVLRNQWGFDGFVVSDYTGVLEMIAHGIGDYATVAARALDAGCDMDMVSEAFNRTLKQSIEDGVVTEAQVDAACRRILEAKYKLGLFDDPYKFCDLEREKTDVYSAENRNAARGAATECMVLLKNEGNLLPLSGNGKVAVIGPLGDSPANMPGMWSFPSPAVKPVSLYQGLKNALGDRVIFAKGCNALDDSDLERKLSKDGVLERDGRSDAAMRKEALAMAKKSEIIIAAMGELSEMTGEGASRADIRIPDPQKALLKELCATGKPVVLVLFTGRPLVLTDEDAYVPAILNVWFAGSEAGDAIADVLTGKVNPSGKLPVSFPYHIGQLPISYNHKNTGRPMPEGQSYIKYRSNYQDIPNEPLYPFGYGLSYTTFEYGDVTLSADRMGQDGSVTASVTVRNTGNVDGKEVVQLYIRDLVSTSTRPVKELKGFEKIYLKAGESKVVSFTVSAEMLKYYNHDLEFVCEPGEFEIMVGPDSRNVKKVTLTVE